MQVPRRSDKARANTNIFGSSRGRNMYQRLHHWIYNSRHFFGEPLKCDLWNPIGVPRCGVPQWTTDIYQGHASTTRRHHTVIIWLYPAVCNIHHEAISSPGNGGYLGRGG